MGIDRDTVPTQARPRVEGHEAIGLTGRRPHDFPDVEAQLVAHQGYFVDQSDVDRAERIFQELDYFGRGRARHRHRLIDNGPVKGDGDFQTVGCHAADDFRRCAHGEVRPARVDAFWRKGHEKVATDFRVVPAETR